MPSVAQEMTKAESDAQTIRRLETTLKNQGEQLQEYILAEKVMIAAGKVSEDTARLAHEIARACS